MKIYLVDFENVKSKGLIGIDGLDETDSVIIFYSENSDTISFEMHQKVLTSKAEIEYFKVNVGGKNALDFQLSTLLGYMVAKENYSHIFVISNDRGFDFLHDFWSGKYVDSPSTIVYRTRTISAAISFAKAGKTGDNEVEENFVQAEISEQVQAVEEVSTTILPVEEVAVSEEETIEIPQSATEPVVENVITKPAKKPENYTELLDYVLSPLNCNKEELATISELILSSSTKEELHNSLAKTFKQQATEMYKLLRPQYLKLVQMHNSEIAPQSTAIDKNKEKPARKPRTRAVKKVEPIEVTAEKSSEEKVVYSDVLSVRLSELLDNLCTEEELVKIKELFENAKTKQQLYIRMVKAFKKEKGCEFYNAIRSEYTNLQKQQEN